MRFSYLTINTVFIWKAINFTLPIFQCTRWRHQMETFSALLAICAGNSPVPGEFPTQRPVTRNCDVFFDLRPNNGWVNNGEAGELRRHRAHYDVIVMKCFICATYTPRQILTAFCQKVSLFEGFVRILHVCFIWTAMQCYRCQYSDPKGYGQISLIHNTWMMSLGTNFSEILNKIHTFPFKKMYLKISSGKLRPFCLGLNVLMGNNSLPPWQIKSDCT